MRWNSRLSAASRRNDDPVRECAAVLHVQAKIRHPVLRIRPMAGEAIVGKNRPDLAIEIDRAARAG